MYVNADMARRAKATRRDSFGQELTVTLAEWAVLEPNPGFFSGTSWDERPSAALVSHGDHWAVLQASHPDMRDAVTKRVAGAPADLTWYTAPREWFRGWTVRMHLSVVVRSAGGSPVLVNFRTAGREQISRGYLTKRFEQAVSSPTKRQVAQARRHVMKMTSHFGSHAQYMIDQATYHLALETGGHYGAIARAVDERTAAEIEDGFRDPVAEFLTRATIVGGSDVAVVD